MSKTSNQYKLFDFVFPGGKVAKLVKIKYYSVNCNKIQQNRICKMRLLS
jgi:hypothetical protein